MVVVKEVKSYESNQGKEFFGLIVQSGAIPVRSKDSGRIYLTAKTAFVPTTFDELMCESLIGTEFPGTIKQISCEDYDFTIKETGEVVTMNHRWEYVDDSLEIIEKQVVEKTSVF